VAGGLALLLIIVVATRTRSKSTTVVTPTPVTRPTPAPPPPPSTSVPESARRHLAQAIDYQRRLWCSDAIEELDKALRDDASLRDDVSLQRTAISCLTPKTRDRAVRLLVERVGGSARGELERAATESANSEVRKGARATLERLPR
jgi:hypothetical protein